MALPKKQANELYTYTDYLNWHEDERWEIIEGVPFPMSPTPTSYHQELLTQLMIIIGTFLKGKSCKLYPAPFDVRFTDYPEEPDDRICNVVQPDISVICDPAKIDIKGCKGAPDWIIEILSPSSSARDLKFKLSLYEKYGVKEYWIVDPSNKIVFVYRLGGDNLYKKSLNYAAEDKIESSVLTDLTVDLTEVFIS